MSSKYRTQPLATTELPAGIPYIVGNEAAERFSFYGMRGILFVFMTQYLHWMTEDPNAVAMSEAEARENFHSFVMWVYLTPVFGALLSDGLLGKYPTILSLSMVYCAGHLCLALMGLPPLTPAAWLLAGLALIAIGSGGIKPCVSAHVGDQFGYSNRHWLPRVYGWFYFAINTGSFISNLLTPWLLKWYGPHWAFGVPGVLMALATLVFWLGRYKFIHVPAGGKHFLRETFSPLGLTCMAKLAIIFAFVSVFWSLFDQTGSSWIEQAEQLDLHWMFMDWLPAQIQAVNPIMILVFIPVFASVIYPLINEVFPLTPIRKISMGLFVTVASFALVALVQHRIDLGARPSVGWQVLAYVILTAGEIMVSITALEFAYTQAPRNMKSIIMALYLSSIALGNLFTMQVNAFIQVPNQLDTVARAHDAWYEPGLTQGRPDAAQQRRIEQVRDVYGTPVHWEPYGPSAYAYVLAGDDRQFGTLDDIRVVYSDQGVRVGVLTAANDVLAEGRMRIQQAYADKGQLPDEGASVALLSGLEDPWSRPLQYILVNRQQFRLISLGADGQDLTPDDIWVATPVGQQGESEAADGDNSSTTWLADRKEQLAGQRATRQTGEAVQMQVELPPVAKDVHVGGRTTLRGAAYFWFFTAIMAVTAVAFVAVGAWYKPQDFLQQESSGEGA